MFQYNDCLGSSFNKKYPDIYSQGFQYNDCLGSSVVVNGNTEILESFNTTIVWVRLFNCISITASDVSFNTTIVWVRPFASDSRRVVIKEFQYNDCLGSSTSRFVDTATFACFNTTIVWVRPIASFIIL